MNLRNLHLPDTDKIGDWSFKLTKKQFDDESSHEFYTWTAPFRRESLEYYLPLGWSFGLWSSPNEDWDQFEGYFLANVLPFFESQTQVLWVEALFARDENSLLNLADCARRLAREKHLQRVYFSNLYPNSDLLNTLKSQTNFLETTKSIKS